MSSAPPELMDARSLLITHLGINPASVGIVGDAAHAAGGDSYHLGKDQLRASASYSVRESPRDSRPDNDASAIDVGTFSRSGGNLRHFSLWLVAHCKAGTWFTKNIREVIYSPDGDTVKRWDRLGKRSTGDDSHTWHTHISFFRDSNGAGAREMVREYLYELGILKRPAPVAPVEEEEIYMLSETAQVPIDFAFDNEENLENIDDPSGGSGREGMLAFALEPAGLAAASVWKDKSLYLSASTDMVPEGASVRIRVAVYDGAGWTVKYHNLTPGGRVSLSSHKAKSNGAFNVTVGRARTAELDEFVAPIGFTWTIV